MGSLLYGDVSVMLAGLLLRLSSTTCLPTGKNEIRNQLKFNFKYVFCERFDAL